MESKNRLPLEFVLVDEHLDSSNKHIFKTQLTISGQTICEATGSNKKESQQNASFIALQLIQSHPQFIGDVLALNEISQPVEN